MKNKDLLKLGVAFAIGYLLAKRSAPMSVIPPPGLPPPPPGNNTTPEATAGVSRSAYVGYKSRSRRTYQLSV